MRTIRIDRNDSRIVVNILVNDILHDTRIMSCIRSIHNGNGTSRSSLNYTKTRSTHRK